MGKKNFVENYDPLKAHLSRDVERSSGAGQAQVLEQVPKPEPDVVPEPKTPPQPVSHRKIAPSAAEPKVIQRKAAPALVETAPSSPEMSARIKVSSVAFQDLESMLSNVHRASGSKVHYSIATRALWGLLVQAEAQVIEEVRKAGLGRLPSTRGHVEYADYEERVKLAFASAFRRLPRTMFQAPSNSAEQEAEG